MLIMEIIKYLILNQQDNNYYKFCSDEMIAEKE